MVAMAAASACAPPSRTPTDVRAPLGTPPFGLHAGGMTARPDPTVRGARLAPESIDEDKTFGVEPGGGLRAIAAGVRVVGMPNGAVMVAGDRLPVAPAITTPLPDRLGGGFLFVLGSTVWRAERWLAPARPIYASPVAIARVTVGLDRVYLRATSGAHQALDPRSGTVLDLGPWPGSSYVGAYAAVDGWRAVAVNDLRGVVATFDAGATWRALDLPMDAHEVTVSGDAIAVGGFDATRTSTWFEVRGDGQVGKLSGPPGEPSRESSGASMLPAPASDRVSKSFGRRPLVAAVEDGWPLADGTALVARDGALARIRLDDGALAEIVPDAYPLRPSRCHPVPLARSADAAAFGFVCGEPRGVTALYAYDARLGQLIEKRRFDTPRLVLASGNGALAVRGPCAAAGGEEEAGTHTYCTLARDDAWREIHVRGEIGGERVVVLADGRFVIVSPPEGDLTGARLTLLEQGRARSVAIQLPPLTPDVLRVLKVGVWLDGMEERRPGVLGGWIEAGGSMLGIEIDLDGHARLGDFVREAGSPMVSGRYGLGWTPSRRGYETVDGGMTWTPLDLPEPIAAPRMVTSRACGPIGCTAAGWLRIGWGPPVEAAPPDPPPVARATPGRGFASLSLRCDEVGPAPKAASNAPPRRPAPHELLPSPLPGGASSTLAELPAFYTFPGPPLRPDDRGLAYEASDVTGRVAQLGAVARVYAWGPRTGEWEHAGRWMARWMWPFGASQDVHATLPSLAPPLLVDVARYGTLGPSAMMPPTWSFAPGDDASHALLVARRSARADAAVFEVEGDRAPLEIHRADGDPFTDIDAAMRSDGRWYLATPAAPGELPASIVWQVDGPVARELARVPRGGVEVRPPAARLAHRSDGHVIGLVVDGQPSAERAGPVRWVLPVDLATGSLGEPEALGSADLGDRSAITLCAPDDEGWILDAPAALPVAIATADQSLGPLHGAFVRMRLSSATACIERMAGTLDAYVAEHVPRAAPAGAAPSRAAPRSNETSISVSVFATRSRHALRCVRR